MAQQEPPIEVLLIEDSPGDARLIQNALDSRGQEPFRLRTCARLAEGLAAIDKQPADVVLLGLSLPDSQGLQTFTNAHARAPAQPFLVLTGLDDETVAVEAVKAGAQDFLLKRELAPEVLMRSIRYAIERHRLAGELRQRTEALAASEARSRLLIERNADGIVILGDAGEVLFANPSAQTLLADSSGELAQRLRELPHGIDDPVVIDLGEGDDSLAFEVARSDIQWQGRRAQLASVRDVSESRRAEVLRRRERYFRSLIENCSDVIALLDAEGILRYVSPSVKRILGYEPSDLLGSNAFSLIHSDDAAAVRDLFTTGTQREGATGSSVYRFRHRDGTWRHHESVGTNLLHDPVSVGAWGPARSRGNSISASRPSSLTKRTSSGSSISRTAAIWFSSRSSGRRLFDETGRGYVRSQVFLVSAWRLSQVQQAESVEGHRVLSS